MKQRITSGSRGAPNSGRSPPVGYPPIHPFRSIESGLATLRDHPLDDMPTVGEVLISGRQCPEGLHVVRQQHPSLDHKRMGRTKRSDRFPQGRARIDIGEKGLAPIGVGRKEIGATRHMGATVIRHGGIIPPMNGAGTRATLATASSPIAMVPSTWSPAGPPSMPPPPHLAKQKPWNLPRSGPSGPMSTAARTGPRTAAPDQSPPPSPSGHRPTALPMGGLNRTGRARLL